jgi:hypothetical protein
MRHREISLLAIAFAPVLLFGPSATHAAEVFVAWNDAKAASGTVRSLQTSPPSRFRGASVTTGANPLLHYAFGRLFVVSPLAGTITVVTPRSRGTARVYRLGDASEPEDIAVVSRRTAYVTLRRGTHLVRLDLRSGATADAVDLSLFADADGIPDLGTMAIDRGRLFVQVRRANEDGEFGFSPPAYLAVIDLATEQLVDVDSQTPGVQAIELQGTAPKQRMQIVGETRQLFVSATGGFFDAGGIEVIDLDTLRSLGLVIREADGFTGADLGPFVMVTPERGFLVYSTDLDLSSHLKGFSLSGGVEPGRERHVSVGYFVPSLVHDPRTHSLFVPDGTFGRRGIFVFDADSGEILTKEPIVTEGPPTDLLLRSPR